jgi:hypothetical protein
MVLLAFVTAAVVIGVDTTLALLRTVMFTSILAGAVAAAGAGLAFWMTRRTRESIVLLVDRVKTQGYMAAEGAPYVTGEVDDPSLPIELRELAAVVEDLLEHLSTRQAELKDAIRDAEAAEETLGVVVSESTEVKILLEDGRVVLANPAAATALDRPMLLGVTMGEALAGIDLSSEDSPSITPSGGTWPRLSGIRTTCTTGYCSRLATSRRSGAWSRSARRSSRSSRTICAHLCRWWSATSICFGPRSPTKRATERSTRRSAAQLAWRTCLKTCCRRHAPRNCSPPRNSRRYLCSWSWRRSWVLSDPLTRSASCSWSTTAVLS